MRVGIEIAAGLFERGDVAPHQHAARRGIDILVEHGDDTGAQILAGGIDREIGLVHRIAGGQPQRHGKQRTDDLHRRDDAGQAGGVPRPMRRGFACTEMRRGVRGTRRRCMDWAVCPIERGLAPAGKCHVSTPPNN